ncbi:MAG TPA: zinc-binding dehydrogenase [Acidimicrobiales bacterium]|nr:zinc-binding dehydrogenase [Acidimicrobiales bacterium]
MKALQMERSVARFAAARAVSEWRSGGGGRVGPLRLVDTETPELPGTGWEVVRPRLSGICGSDLATVDGRSSRWFEPIVSFPFVPGHEIVADTEDGRRVVVEPVLHCAIRAIEPRCAQCAAGRTNHCERLTTGHLSPGLQSGYCADTGGGWSLAMVAHTLQLHDVPVDWSDQAAVMVEPVACAVHGALSAPAGDETTAVVIGAGTLGLATIAAVRRLRPDIVSLISVAKHPEQRRLASELGAATVVEPDALRRAVRRSTGGWLLDNGQLTAGAPVVFDCVGSAQSLSESLAVVAPGGTVVMIGMPGHVDVDLTGLWQREVRLVGAYAYGPEPAAGGRHSFDLSMELVDAAGLERLVTATYPLDRYSDAIEHAAAAGRRGAVKVAFDMRDEKRR